MRSRFALVGFFDLSRILFSGAGSKKDRMLLRVLLTGDQIQLPAEASKLLCTTTAGQNPVKSAPILHIGNFELRL